MITHEFNPNSTFISKITFSEDRMTVFFHDGQRHEYYPPLLLPPTPPYNLWDLFQRFIKNESVGKFWHKEIKNKIPFKRIK